MVGPNLWQEHAFNGQYKSAMAFNILPIEVNQLIASHLEADQDITSFRAVCHSTQNAIDSEKHSFWRQRFFRFYDPFPSGNHSHKRIKEQYQKRRRIFRKGAAFRSGNSHNEERCLGILTDLISDTFTGEVFHNDEGELSCRNMEAIRRFAHESGLLRNMCRPSSKKPTTSLLAAVQVILTHLSLNQALFCEVYGFPDSQKQVYLSAQQAPIFVGFDNLEVNVHWLVHVANFFKYYMVRKEERNGLFDAMEDLPAGQKPRGWIQTPGTSSGKLERYWRGTYAFLERREVRYIREGLNDSGNRILMDQHVDSEKPIQTMTLDLPEEVLPWPEYFETHLKSNPKHSAARTKAQHRWSEIPSRDLVPIRFQGCGHDDFEDFNSAGYVAPIPSQHGVSGWQRMTMMKYYVDDTGDIDMEALWAYEGVVLPGGRIILGRWWSPDDSENGDEIYSGPFILWAVEPPICKNADAE